jgi:hypothetical protein
MFRSLKALRKLNIDIFYITFNQGRINVSRGPWHIISAGPLDPLPSNGILDTKVNKIRKYPLVFHALKSLQSN